MIHSTLYQAGLLFQKSIPRACSAFWSHVVRAPAFLAACWEQDRRRMVHFVPVAMGLGIAAYFSLPFEPAPAAALAQLAFTGAAASLMRVARPDGTRVLASALVCVSLGFALAALRTSLLVSPQVTSPVSAVDLQGRIVDLDATPRGGQRLLVDAWLEGNDTPVRLRLSSSRMWPGLSPGDWIRTTADLKPLPEPVMPGGFDFGRKLWFDGVRGIAFTLHDIERIDERSNPGTVARMAAMMQRARDAVTARILAGTSTRAGPVAAAFLTGERSGISEADNAAMQAASLSHLLSISGLHMVLAGFGVFAALRHAACLAPALAHRADVKKWAAVAALVASFAYLLLSGASIPTQRAFVTVAMAFLAILADRNAISMRTVAIAATIVLATTPEAWMDPSFQMSFCAVVMLVAAYEWWNAVRLRYWRDDGWGRRILAAVIGTAITSIIAGLATAPFAAFHFNRLSAYGVVANVLVMPLVSLVIMPAGVLSLLLMPLGLEWPALQVMDRGLLLMLDAASWIASWPMSAIGVPAFPVEALLLLALGFLWLAGCFTALRLLGTIPVLMGLAVAVASQRPDMLVSRSGGNVALRAHDGTLSFSSARRARFDAEIWLRADGDTRDVADAVARDQSVFACSAGACVADLPGKGIRIAVMTSRANGTSQCPNADIVVTNGSKTSGCRRGDAMELSELSLQYSGAVSVRFGAGEWTVETVAATRGQRPWVAAVKQQPEAGFDQ